MTGTKVRRVCCIEGCEERPRIFFENGEDVTMFENTGPMSFEEWWGYKEGTRLEFLDGSAGEEFGSWVDLRGKNIQMLCRTHGEAKRAGQ